MGSKGVQFRGCGQLMQAFDNSKITKWAVFYDKNINCKYQEENWTESRETLRLFLELLSKSGSTAVYTLSLYEDLKKDQKIKASTEADYAYNFTLFDDEMTGNQFYGRRAQESEAMQNRILQLEAKLKLAEEEDDEEEEGGIGGVINGILGSERFKSWIQDKAFLFADKLIDPKGNVVDMNNNQGKLGKVGAVKDTDPILIDEVQQKRAAEAVEVLARVDPYLGDNLLKIAAIAQSDPAKYKAFAAML
jgi:hypothetical protein